MNKPSLDRLLGHVPNKYALVTIAAKRARQITAQTKDEHEFRNNKPVSEALRQIDSGQVKPSYPNSQSKEDSNASR